MKYGPRMPAPSVSIQVGRGLPVGKIFGLAGSRCSGIPTRLCGSMCRKFPSKYKDPPPGSPAWKASRQPIVIAYGARRPTRQMFSFSRMIDGCSCSITPQSFRILNRNMAHTLSTECDTAFRISLDVRSIHLTEEQFYLLCRDNRDLRLELSAEGELVIMPPTYTDTVGDVQESPAVWTSGLKRMEPGPTDWKDKLWIDHSSARPSLVFGNG